MIEQIEGLMLSYLDRLTMALERLRRRTGCTPAKAKERLADAVDRLFLETIVKDRTATEEENAVTDVAASMAEDLGCEIEEALQRVGETIRHMSYGREQQQTRAVRRYEKKPEDVPLLSKKCADGGIIN